MGPLGRAFLRCPGFVPGAASPNARRRRHLRGLGRVRRSRSAAVTAPGHRAESHSAPSARIWHKLAAIALTLIVPLALTAHFLIGEALVRIDFAKQELRGVEYL